MTLGALFVLLIVSWIVAVWPRSDQYMRARGLEKLESYIQGFQLNPMPEVRLCDLISVDDEPGISKFFLCRVDLVDGTLHFDVAFTLNGAVEYSDGEITKP